MPLPKNQEEEGPRNHTGDRPIRPGVRTSTSALSLAALGVVFGDIGTSPLYALKACFTATYNLKPDQMEIMGVLSIIFWSLFLVITGKYLTILMRLDSRGEGGICAMLELVRNKRLSRRWKTIAIAATIVGAALLFGDGMITPAISVLSAMEGLSLHSAAAGRFAMPIAVVILVVLFGIQRFGTGKMGMLFGPIMLLWFIMIGVFGVMSILKAPEVLLSVDPRHAAWFVQRHAGTAFVVLGAIVLVVTGGEALYADMGHFGRRAIRIAWLVVVWPALLLSYFGQGANLLVNTSATGNPFFAIVPPALLWPMIILAAFAAAIASQAIISGIFSLARQASHLSLFPPHKVVHTSSERIGQIYSPAVNYMLGFCCIILVIVFHKSDALAAAYGVAVTGLMVLSTLMFMLVSRVALHWPRILVLILGSIFITIDLLFFSANLLKIKDGGWIPLAVAALLTVMMVTWLRGTTAAARQYRNRSVSFTAFKKNWDKGGPKRVPGTGIFLTTSRIGVPASMTTLYRNLHVLHETVVLLSVHIEEVPFVEPSQRVQIHKIPDNFWHVTARHGYLDEVDSPAIIQAAIGMGLPIDIENATYFVRQLVIDTSGSSRMSLWQRRLFLVMHRNALPAVWAFRLPPNRTVAIGIVVRI